MGWADFKAAFVPFFLAMGVTLGGGLLGSFGQWLAGQPEINPALIAYRIRIWAVAMAIGGTLTVFEQLEQHLTSRALGDAGKTALLVGVAYLGAEIGFWVVAWWSQGRI
ncbi:MAG: sporulation protein [Sulfobacillus sp.]|nr:sporulation protein [Sulfobacillus sp.]